MLGNAVIYFAHTVPTAKRINLGKATKRLLSAELAVSAAWPSEEAVRVPPSLAGIEKSLAQLTQLKAWAESLHGWPSLIWNSLVHPVTTARVLRLARESRRRTADGTPTADSSLEDTVVEVERILLDVQKVTIAERKIDGDLFWSDAVDGDDYVRLFLRTTEHTIEVGGEETTITLEPRLLLHREGVAQITIGVDLPMGCTPEAVIEASFPGSPLFHTSRIPEPYAAPGSEWAGGEWADELEGGVRVRRLEHDEPASVNDWLEMIIGRVLQVIGASHDGPWYTYPMIVTQVGDCCKSWAVSHQQEIAQLAARAVPRRDSRLALDTGPDLSTFSDTRMYATAGSALVLHLRPWEPGMLDLYQTLPYERAGLAFVRLRRLEQRISYFRTGKRDVLQSYRSLLQIEKELRGAFYRAGTARAISRHVLSDLGAFEILEAVRNGVGMLGERAGTRASARAARASNRIALVALTVAVIAAIPAIPAILTLIEEQRAANPDATAWSVVQTLATTPLLLSALILSAVLLYLVVLFFVLVFRVVRYLLSLRKQGFASRVDGYEITVGGPEALEQPDDHS